MIIGWIIEIILLILLSVYKKKLQTKSNYILMQIYLNISLWNYNYFYSFNCLLPNETKMNFLNSFIMIIFLLLIYFLNNNLLIVTTVTLINSYLICYLQYGLEIPFSQLVIELVGSIIFHVFIMLLIKN